MLRPFAPALLLTSLACTHVVQERELFPVRKLPIHSDRITRQNLEVTIEAGRLRGWVLRHPEARANVIYFTGNGEQVVRTYGRLQGLAELLRANVICVDYRGNGGSDGTPGLGHLQQDALRVFDATADMRGALPTLAFSYSIGTWSAVHLAAHRPVAGLVLAAPFSAYRDVMGAARRLAPWFVRPFVRLEVSESMAKLTQPLQEMPQVKAPLLVLQGESDVITPPHCGRHMHEAAGSLRKRLVSVPGVGHDGMAFTTEPMASALKAFLEEVSAASAPAPAAGASSGR